MKKETDLLSYLPPFLGEFKETKEDLKAIEPEFDIAWDGAERILRNEFIATADEDGIKRFETLLKILPSSEDSLELRRARVLNKWLSKLPYTVKMLIKNLTNLCGGDDFVLRKNFDNYEVNITTHFREYSQVEELRKLLNEMIPANMGIVTFNIAQIKAEGKAAVYTGFRVSGKHKKIRDEQNTKKLKTLNKAIKPKWAVSEKENNKTNLAAKTTKLSKKYSEEIMRNV